ncbi:MAG: DUF5683 domain-containing protein [Rikenellaceae bacterium]|nr:DUF5683 domain-containing protein [Rikenellaceae bacterium]
MANRTPKPSNRSFYYTQSTEWGSDIQAAREGSYVNLFSQVRSTITRNRSTTEGLGILDQIVPDNQKDVMITRYQIGRDVVTITAQRVDEYWETFMMADGEVRYEYTGLYAVGYPEYPSPEFDQVGFTYRYGMRGVVRSLIPGYGQLYKGQKGKGAAILAGEVALITGIIFTHQEYDNYRKKIKQTHNIDHIRTYSNKADNYKTARNICIGGAAALYIYNLVDAAVSPGRKRLVTNRKNSSSFAIIPVTNTDYNGVNLSMTF